jgi:hypothetical protein
MHVRWDVGAAATPHGQLVFFAEFLAATGVFERWVSGCPLEYRSGNAPDKRDVLGTLMMGMLAGHRRYAHITALRGDAVAAQALGMNKVVSEDALRRGLVGQVASFETYKLDVGRRLPAAAGGGSITMDTRAAALNYYVPAATSTATTTGETSNVDNRYQTITVSSTTSVVAGDAFTVAGSNAVHHITKGDTGVLKTHRVISVPSSTTLVISPPLISNQGGSNAEAQYQNVIVTESATAAIVFLNTVAANVNPFWHKDAMLLIPSKLAVPSDAGAAVMRGTTDQGVELVMIKEFDIQTRLTRYRLDTSFGVACVQPQMAGIMMFSQT